MKLAHPFSLINTTEQKEILRDTGVHLLCLCANLIVLLGWLVYATVWACVFAVNTMRSSEFHYSVVVFLMDQRDRVPHSVTAITPVVWTKLDQWLDMLHLKTSSITAIPLDDYDEMIREVGTDEDEDEE